MPVARIKRKSCQSKAIRACQRRNTPVAREPNANHSSQKLHVRVKREIRQSKAIRACQTRNTPVIRQLRERQTQIIQVKSYTCVSNAKYASQKPFVRVTRNMPVQSQSRVSNANRASQKPFARVKQKSPLVKRHADA